MEFSIDYLTDAFFDFISDRLLYVQQENKRRILIDD